MACVPLSVSLTDVNWPKTGLGSGTVSSMHQKEPKQRARAIPTLADVARLAGVSSSTVSRVLNEPLLVRQDTIDAVQRAIAQIGYTPNILAGGLASNRTKLVAVIVPTIANSIFADTVQAITDVLAREGYQTLIGVSGYDLDKEDDLLRAIIGRRPDGLILTGTVHSPESRARLLAASIPIVETWDYTPTPLDMVVGFSHAEVGRAVARFLAERGHQKVGLLSSSDQRASVRLQGLVEELAVVGGSEHRIVTVPPANNITFGRSGLAGLLDKGWQPDIVVCSSDALALGAISEASSRGLSVPGDLAVLGFGDLDFGAFTSPALTTVHVDRVGIGQIAADALLARLRGEPPARRTIDVGFSIVARQSG